MTRSANAGLSTPLLEDEHIHRHFTRAAGAAYGAVVASVFALAVWWQEVAALRDASSALGWQHLALGLIIFLPLSTLIGWLSASARWSAFTLGWWILGVALMAWLAGRLPYEGLSFIARLSDPYPPPYPMYPASVSAAGYAVFSAIIGALAGLFVGLLSLPALDKAWDYSTKRHHLGARSMLALLLCTPPLIIAGLMTDFQANSSLRAAFVEVDQVIATASDPATDLTRARLPYMQSFRDQLSPNYTLYWTQSSAEQTTFVIDAQFNSGLVIRCTFGFGNVLGCSNLGQNTHEWMAQLMTVGHTTCASCDVQVDRETRRWLAGTLPAMGVVRDVQLLSHQGGWLYQRATFENGSQIDCRFGGNRPIKVDLCLVVN
ncbi:MAG: hypothetical protein HY870_09575 [Chloroflexi bacterium]|nr:hypothetical protein [Chloroflexota bacterium]